MDRELKHYLTAFDRRSALAINFKGGIWGRLAGATFFTPTL